MAYHSEFWLTIGAAAPVIGLGHLVSIFPALERGAGKLAHVDKPGYGKQILAFLSALISLFGAGICALAFADALNAMAATSDHPGVATSVGLDGTLLAVAFFGLLWSLTAALATVVGCSVGGGPEPPPPSQSLT